MLWEIQAWKCEEEWNGVDPEHRFDGARTLGFQGNRQDRGYICRRSTRAPWPGAGCLECHYLIPAAMLAQEALSEEERRRQRYVDDDSVVQPSVITLNVLSAAQAVNDLMMMFTGLFRQGVSLQYQIGFARERSLCTVEPRAEVGCLHCSSTTKSRRARGDRARLPCRAPKVTPGG